MASAGQIVPAARPLRVACIQTLIFTLTRSVIMTGLFFAVFRAPGYAADNPPAPVLSPAATLPGAIPPAVPAATVKLPAQALLPKLLPRPASPNPTWKELPPQFKQALAPLATEWDRLDAPHKSKWVEIARKFTRMKPEEKDRIQERMRAWVALTPDQRRLARESFVRTKKLNTDQKSDQWQQYQQLSPEQKASLAEDVARKNKVVTLPSHLSKPKIVPPIKSLQKPLLLQPSPAPSLSGKSVTTSDPAVLPAGTPAVVVPASPVVDK